MKHVVHIIPENSSSLDFTFPIFWKNCQSSNPNYKFSVIFFYLNNNAVLKNSSFYENIGNELGIKFYDLTEFLVLPVFIKKFIRKIYNFSNTDKIYLSEKYNYYSEKSVFWPVLLFNHLIRNYRVTLIVKTIKIKILNEFAKILLSSFFSFKRVIENLEISAILFDNRGRKNFFGSTNFFKTVSETKIPVVLMPHGPHFRTPGSEYCQFLPDKTDLPSFCRHWMPFKYGKPWENTNTPKSQFKYVGYPGMDKDWIDYLKQQKKNKSIEEQINILYIIRRYVNRSNQMYNKSDYYIVDKKDVFSPLENLIGIIKEQELDVNIVIKPHPKNSIEQLQYDFRNLDFQNIEISSEPIYKLVLETDLVLSLHSTILFIPILMGIPTILINNDLHKKVVSKWSILKELYNNLSFFLKDKNELENIFLSALNCVNNSKINLCNQDIEHLYEYYNKNSTERALLDLNHLTS